MDIETTSILSTENNSLEESTQLSVYSDTSKFLTPNHLLGFISKFFYQDRKDSFEEDDYKQEEQFPIILSNKELDDNRLDGQFSISGKEIN
jgi:hypothetical protein